VKKRSVCNDLSTCSNPTWFYKRTFLIQKLEKLKQIPDRWHDIESDLKWWLHNKTVWSNFKDNTDDDPNDIDITDPEYEVNVYKVKGGIETSKTKEG